MPLAYTPAPYGVAADQAAAAGLVPVTLPVFSNDPEWQQQFSSYYFQYLQQYLNGQGPPMVPGVGVVPGMPYAGGSPSGAGGGNGGGGGPRGNTAGGNISNAGAFLGGGGNVGHAPYGGGFASYPAGIEGGRGFPGSANTGFAQRANRPYPRPPPPPYRIGGGAPTPSAEPPQGP